MVNRGTSKVGDVNGNCEGMVEHSDIIWLICDNSVTTQNLIFLGETFKGFEVLLSAMSATTTQLLFSGEFCKFRCDTIPVQNAFANISFYTHN
jgi:hypothetical protein